MQLLSVYDNSSSSEEQEVEEEASTARMDAQETADVQVPAKRKAKESDIKDSAVVAPKIEQKRQKVNEP